MTVPDDTDADAVDGLDPSTVDDLRSLGWVASTERAKRRPYTTGVPPLLHVGKNVVSTGRQAGIPIVRLQDAR